MTPPLVRDLVRSHVGDDVDLLVVLVVEDEADALRVGNRVGEALREVRVGRKLEDACLLELERREALDSELAALDASIATLQSAAAQLSKTIAETETEIDGEIARESAARAELAQPVTESLLRDYERRRAQNRGAGAARLVGTTCQACHLTVPSTEAEQIRRAAGSVIGYCDNCSAILVP